MKKKTKTRGFRFNANVLRNILIVYAVLGTTLSIFLMSTFYSGYTMQQRIFAESGFRMMVRDASLAHFDPLERLAGGTKLYVPESGFAFPIVPGEGDVLYKYEMAIEGTPSETSPETVVFASKSAINALNGDMGAFECQRMVTASFSKYDAYAEKPFEYVGSVKLGTMRELFLYQNKSSQCERVWSGMTAQELVDQLKKAEDYTPAN